VPGHQQALFVRRPVATHQSVPPFKKTSRVFPVDVERKWILPSFAPKTTIARYEPSQMVSITIHGRRC
jgi:hypothetical protein